MSFLQRAREVLDAGQGWAGLGGDSLAFVLAQLVEQGGRWLVVVDEPDAAERLMDGLGFFLREPGRALLLPADDLAEEVRLPDGRVVRSSFRYFAGGVPMPAGPQNQFLEVFGGGDDDDAAPVVLVEIRPHMFHRAVLRTDGVVPDMYGSFGARAPIEAFGKK